MATAPSTSIGPAPSPASTATPDRLWRAVEIGDPRFDGWVYLGVKTTGIYCRPSCPARTPKRENARLFPSAAAAQGAGFRACKRCRPDLLPGSPEWDLGADVAARAMRMIADGVVDREGVAGLAGRLGYTERHIHRRLVAQAGAGPLALARAQRASNARILIETTSLPLIEVAFAAGFASVRQFNATIKEIFATTPTALRSRARVSERSEGSGAIVLRLPYRPPLDAAGLLAFLARRAVGGIEEVSGALYRRSLRLPHGQGVVELDLGGDSRAGGGSRAGDGRHAGGDGSLGDEGSHARDGLRADGGKGGRTGGAHINARFWLSDLRDLGAAIQRCRMLLDLDSDPVGVVTVLGEDPLLGGIVDGAPGRRVPGSTDPNELAVRAVLGQQVSLAGARTVAGRLVVGHGEPLERPLGGVTHLFPEPSAIAAVDPAKLAMPGARARAVLALAEKLASGELDLRAGADRHRARADLIALPGIGPWTAEYVAMRALRDPDAFIASDLGVRRALERLGESGDPKTAEKLAERWRPYRAYAVQHLWASLAHRQPSASRTDLRPPTDPLRDRSPNPRLIGM